MIFTEKEDQAKYDKYMYLHIKKSMFFVVTINKPMIVWNDLSQVNLQSFKVFLFQVRKSRGNIHQYECVCDCWLIAWKGSNFKTQWTKRGKTRLTFLVVLYIKRSLLTRCHGTHVDVVDRGFVWFAVFHQLSFTDCIAADLVINCCWGAIFIAVWQPVLSSQILSEFCMGMYTVTWALTYFQVI